MALALKLNFFTLSWILIDVCKSWTSRWIPAIDGSMYMCKYDQYCWASFGLLVKNMSFVHIWSFPTAVDLPADHATRIPLRVIGKKPLFLDHDTRMKCHHPSSGKYQQIKYSVGWQPSCQLYWAICVCQLKKRGERTKQVEVTTDHPLLAENISCKTTVLISHTDMAIKAPWVLHVPHRKSSKKP